MRWFAILWFLSSLMLISSAGRLQAERPPQFRDKAMLAVSGTVKKIVSENSPFLDGILTEYTAEVVVDSVEKGENVKAGDTIKVFWFHVTKLPSRPAGGAYGHGYPLKKLCRAKFWLMDRTAGPPAAGEDCWAIIYNEDGVELIKK